MGRGHGGRNGGSLPPPYEKIKDKFSSLTHSTKTSAHQIEVVISRCLTPVLANDPSLLAAFFLGESQEPLISESLWTLLGIMPPVNDPVIPSVPVPEDVIVVDMFLTVAASAMHVADFDHVHVICQHWIAWDICQQNQGQQPCHMITFRLV